MAELVDAKASKAFILLNMMSSSLSLRKFEIGGECGGTVDAKASKAFHFFNGVGSIPIIRTFFEKKNGNEFFCIFGFCERSVAKCAFDEFAFAFFWESCNSKYLASYCSFCCLDFERRSFP